jgi:hypothetical protein
VQLYIVSPLEQCYTSVTSNYTETCEHLLYCMRPRYAGPEYLIIIYARLDGLNVVVVVPLSGGWPIRGTQASTNPGTARE